jgi:cubilin
MCICKPGFIGNGFGDNGCVATHLDPCTALQCKNGGSCIRNGTTAYCECPAGTKPPLCERLVDPCFSNPCMNGGICSASRFGRRYSCACLKGFSGINCQNQARRCGGVRNAESGSIKYPEGSASTYYHNSRCAWLIKTNHTKVLNVTFTKFDVEMSRDCKFDWLQVRGKLAH